MDNSYSTLYVIVQYSSFGSRNGHSRVRFIVALPSLTKTHSLYLCVFGRCCFRRLGFLCLTAAIGECERERERVRDGRQLRSFRGMGIVNERKHSLEMGSAALFLLHRQAGTVAVARTRFLSRSLTPLAPCVHLVLLQWTIWSTISV